MNLKSYLERNRRHRSAVIACEKRAFGRVSLLTRLHDMDKAVMALLCMDAETISRVHRLWSWHHPGSILARMGLFRFSEAYFDWASARLTKPEKPLDAIQTAEKYYPGYVDAARMMFDKTGVK